MTKLQKLISIASDSFSMDLGSEANLNEFPSELSMLLESRNGFCAFESALVVFPTKKYDGVPGVYEWNDLTGWRRHYRTVMADEYLCFAQDLFGLQFAISNAGVIRLNPETGKVTFYARSIEEWAERLLENYAEDTGWPLAHEWQLIHGFLPANLRLLPKLPFVLGGEYEVENLVALDCQQVMDYWGKLYEAIRNLPDGQAISLAGWIN
jgi:hypothetical protein